MLMNIKCETIPQVFITLTFDDNTVKNRLISTHDLIDVTFNANGVRRHLIGKVLKISCSGTDKGSWYIIIDGSDDYKSKQERFAVTSILDCEVLRKASTTKFIESPIGQENVPYLRIIEGQLQYSVDGCEWHSIKVTEANVIRDEIGTIPDTGTIPGSTDGIFDENY